MTAKTLPGVPKLRNILREHHQDERVAWNTIHTSLLETAHYLEQWAYLLGKTAQRPNPTTVRDMAEALDDFHIVQNELLKWLKSKDRSYWTMLLHQLDQVNRSKLWSRLRESLSNYKLSLDDHKQRNDPLPQRISDMLNKKRIRAGDDMLKFANALRDAVERANRSA